MSVRTGDLLGDTHLLVVDASTLGATLVQMLEGLGATVHRARAPMQATAIYYRLYREKIKPRAVIADWWLVAPQSNSHQFFTNNLPEDLCSNLSVCDVLRDVHDLDPSALQLVYTHDTVDAERCLRQRHIDAPVYDRTTVSLEQFVLTVATHEGIIAQRYTTSDVQQAIVSMVKQMWPSSEPRFA